MFNWWSHFDGNRIDNDSNSGGSKSKSDNSIHFNSTHEQLFRKKALINPLCHGPNSSIGHQIVGEHTVNKSHAQGRNLITDLLHIIYIHSHTADNLCFKCLYSGPEQKQNRLKRWTFMIFTCFAATRVPQGARWRGCNQKPHCQMSPNPTVQDLMIDIPL